MRAKRFILAVLGLAALATPANAQSLRDLRAQDADEAALAREAAYSSRLCGRTIPARIDWLASKNWPPDASLADACDGALGAVEAVCRSGRRDLVRRFVCAGDGSGPSLSGGALRYGASPGGGAYAETKAYLDAVR